MTPLRRLAVILVVVAVLAITALAVYLYPAPIAGACPGHTDMTCYWPATNDKE